MRHRGFHPAGDPIEAQRNADWYGTDKSVDDYFRCKHGTDLTERRCEECSIELHALLCEDPRCSCRDPRKERKADERADEHLEGWR